VEKGAAKLSVETPLDFAKAETRAALLRSLCTDPCACGKTTPARVKPLGLPKLTEDYEMMAGQVAIRAEVLTKCDRCLHVQLKAALCFVSEELAW
jgi:hypothetical protein